MKKFNKDELFCSKCLISDSLFRGGGSWAPDCCPNCGGTACTMYQDLTPMQKLRALSVNKEN